MPDRAHPRPLAARGAAVAALFALATRAISADGPAGAVEPPTSVELDLHMRAGMRHTRDQPMVVLWLEDRDGRFVSTLWRFGKPKRWYDDMTVWKAQSAGHETAAALDAITGPTIIQGDTGRLRVPRRWQGMDLLSGRYVLRAESRKDHAKHDSSLSIPLGPAALGVATNSQGYVDVLEIAAAEVADASAPQAPQQLPSIPPAAHVQIAAQPTGTSGNHQQETHP